jgi:hypothetical protein
LWYFMTLPAHTLSPQRKISSWHLAGNNSIIPPYSPDLAPRDFHLLLHLKTVAVVPRPYYPFTGTNHWLINWASWIQSTLSHINMC